MKSDRSHACKRRWVYETGTEQLRQYICTYTWSMQSMLACCFVARLKNAIYLSIYLSIYLLLPPRLHPLLDILYQRNYTVELLVKIPPLSDALMGGAISPLKSLLLDMTVQLSTKCSLSHFTIYNLFHALFRHPTLKSLGGLRSLAYSLRGWILTPMQLEFVHSISFTNYVHMYLCG